MITTLHDRQHIVLVLTMRETKATARDERNIYNLEKQNYVKQNNDNKTTLKEILYHRNSNWSSTYRRCNLHQKTDNYDIACATCSKDQHFLWKKVEYLEKNSHVKGAFLDDSKFDEYSWV